MADKDEESKGQRVTVLFNPRDMSRINAEVERRSEARGYKVYVSDILRELVRDNWPVPE